MSDLVLLSRAQMRRTEPFFPRSQGLPRVDDRRGRVEAANVLY
jgi:putative transposase